MIKYFKRKIDEFTLRQQDSIASSLLISQLINDFDEFLPLSKYSLRPSTIGMILNDIVVNKRVASIEFGAGISTFLMAKLIQKNNLQTRVTSVDHNKEWVEYVNQVLDNKGLSDNIEVIYLPLKEYIYSHFTQTVKWYDQEGLLKRVNGKKFDAVYIDGPPGEKDRFHRYAALPFMYENDLLAQRFFLLLDDINRKQEKKILKLWHDSYGYSFKTINNKIAYIFDGSFNEPRID